MTQRHEVRAEHSSLAHYLESVLAPEQLARPLLISFNQWNFASTTVAEIAATTHAMGGSPIIGLWADKSPIRDVGWTTSSWVSRALFSASRDVRTRRALEAFGIPKSAFIEPPIKHWKPVAPLPIPEGFYRTALRALTYRGALLGRSLLQVHPDRDTPITDDFLWPRKWVRKSIESYAWVYDQVSEVIRERKPTFAVVFNGRFLHDHAVAEAAHHASIPVLAFDFGGNDTDFDLTIDDTHDWSALQGRMRRMYEEWDADEREQLGSRWFEERRAHTDPRNALFVESQTRGRGIDISGASKAVVYFSSSGDEISELDLDWSEYFFGQPGALKALADEVRKDPQAILVVRTHPHKRIKPKRDVEDWYQALKAANPHIHIDEFSDIDSYALMDQADVVVTYGSTTGVEAGYAKRPVIVMGPCAYDELGCATRVRNAEELAQALQDPRTHDGKGALAYGLMMLRRGFTYVYVEKSSDAEAHLAGQTIMDANSVVLKLSDIKKRMESRYLRQKDD